MKGYRAIHFDPRDPDETDLYEIDWEPRLIGVREPGRYYNSGDTVLPPIDTGFYYECTVAGKTSGRGRISWPKTDGSTVPDGSVTWTARISSNATLPSISAQSWSEEDGSDLTISANGIDRFVTSAYISGGEHGADYKVTVQITSGSKTLEEEIVIPVRGQ